MSHKQVDWKDHVKSRSMWAGSKKMQELDQYCLIKNNDSKFGYELINSKMNFPPVLYKLIDEIIVNAIDHHTKNPKKVTEFKMSLDKKGMISVYNDGPGIPLNK